MASAAFVHSGLIVVPTAAFSNSHVSETTEPEASVQISPLHFPDHAVDDVASKFYVLRTATKPLMIVEVMRFTTPHGSWLLVPEDQTMVPDICSNGNLTIVTRVDPLFCALILMDAQRSVGGKDVFQPLEALSVTTDGTNLSTFCSTQQFAILCDVKEAAAQFFYKLNDDKVLAWLKSKFDVLTKQPNIKPEDAIDIISQYISEKWSKCLRKNTTGALEAQQEARKSAQNMALSLMMESAKETNEASRLDNIDRKREKKGKPSKNKPKKLVPKSRKAVGPDAKWWGGRAKASSVRKDNANGGALKRTRSSTSTK